ncbi:MAG: tetratricopeptide repeat protein [Cytophagales bacterium]|nr:tetratricopeptide repeat protein [Cytophagales bacterium]
MYFEVVDMKPNILRTGVVFRGLFLVLCLLVFGTSYAQRKGSYYKAEDYFLRAKLVKAREEIDLVMQRPKLAAKSSTWYLRARIYETIFFGEDEALKEAIGDPATVAIDAYLKVIKLEGKRSEMFDNSRKSVHTLCDYFIRLGASSYKLGDFADAYYHFEKAIKVKPRDSIALFYGGICAQNAKMTEEALSLYYRLRELDKVNKTVYQGLVDLELIEKKNKEAALELLAEAQKRFPEELDFVKQELDVMLRSGQVEAVEKKLKSVAEKDSTNVPILLNIAILYENRGVSAFEEKNYKQSLAYADTAAVYYERVLRIEPGNFISNYNLGIIYVNRAKEIYDVARKMDINEYQKRGKAVMRRGDRVMKKALIYLEQAEKTNPEDKDVLDALYRVYSQLGDESNANRVDKKLNKN